MHPSYHENFSDFPSFFRFFFSRFSRSFHGHHLLFPAQFTFFHGSTFAKKFDLGSPTWLPCEFGHTRFKCEDKLISLQSASECA